MSTFLNVAVIMVAIVLIVALVLQVRGSSAGLFGAGGASFRTRRGVERTLFQFTILLAVLLVALSILSVRLV